MCSSRRHVQIGLSQAFRERAILRAHGLHEGLALGGLQDLLQQQHRGVLGRGENATKWPTKGWENRGNPWKTLGKYGKHVENHGKT